MSSLSSEVAFVHHFIFNLSEMMKDPTVPSQQILLLTALYVHGTLNQTDLESVTGVAKSSNSRNISKLGSGLHAWSNDGPGYVESFEDTNNRRVKRVRLTKKGIGLVEAAIKAAEASVGVKGGGRVLAQAVQA